METLKKYSYLYSKIVTVLQFIMHLLQNLPDNGYDNIMGYQVTSELRLHECYQEMPLEVISKEDWLHTDINCYYNV